MRRQLPNTFHGLFAEGNVLYLLTFQIASESKQIWKKRMAATEPAGTGAPDLGFPMCLAAFPSVSSFSYNCVHENTVDVSSTSLSSAVPSSTYQRPHVASKVKTERLEEAGIADP